MINLVVALKAEARPIVEALDLVEDGPASIFPVYFNDGLSLIVSGVGRSYSAAAAAHLFNRTGQVLDQAWLNIGIAGHQKLPIGSVLIASRITEQATGRRWYPPYVLDVDLSRSQLVTVDKPERYYPECCAYDMEASSFYQIASRCSTAELIQSLKIISDGPESSLDLTVDKISQLIADQMCSIESVLGQLSNLAQELDTARVSQALVTNYLEQWHFTVTQHNQLVALLGRLNARSASLRALPDTSECNDAKAVLKWLEEKLLALPVNLSIVHSKDRVARVEQQS